MMAQMRFDVQVCPVCLRNQAGKPQMLKIKLMPGS